MQRITISLDDKLFDELTILIIQKGYTNRSEIFRDFIREQVRNRKLESDAGYCTAIVSYSCNFQNGDLPEKIISNQSANGPMVLSSMQLHAGDNKYIETLILHGKVVEVRKLGEATIASKGIENGSVHLIPDKAR